MTGEECSHPDCLVGKEPANNAGGFGFDPWFKPTLLSSLLQFFSKNINEANILFEIYYLLLKEAPVKQFFTF